MSQVIITLSYAQKQQKDLALPYEIPMQQLIATLTDALNIESASENSFSLALWDGKKLQDIHPTETLAEKGVMYGDYLQLIQKERAVSIAHLLAKNNFAFALSQKRMALGRSTPTQKVDIDLTPLDTKKMVSRHHASIEFSNSHFTFVDPGSLHGTQINENPLARNTQYLLKDNDTIQLGGAEGVQLKFRLDAQPKIEPGLSGETGFLGENL